MPCDVRPSAVDERFAAALASARDCLDAAAAGVGALQKRWDTEALAAALEVIERCTANGGRLHVTGVGKPEHLARYAASLLSSTGTPAYFLHATEVRHGSAGQVCAGDVVIAISNSGTTDEILSASEAVQAMGARVIAVVGRLESVLAERADVALDAGVEREGGGLNLAPRASVAAELAVLAALSAGMETLSGLTRADYHARHPAGALGERSRD